MPSDVELKPQVYRDPRPAEYFAPFHERVRTREPEAKVYEVVRVLTVLHALITYRARAFGSELVPSGPVILALASLPHQVRRAKRFGADAVWIRGVDDAAGLPQLIGDLLEQRQEGKLKPRTPSTPL